MARAADTPSACAFASPAAGSGQTRTEASSSSSRSRASVAWRYSLASRCVSSVRHTIPAVIRTCASQRGSNGPMAACAP